MVDVVTVGESMVLFQPLQDGPLTYAPLYTRTIAGAESNVAIALSRLGLKVRWISRVGVDPFGQMIVSALAGEGVDVSYVQRDPSAPTGIFFKEFKAGGDPYVHYYRKGSAASLLSPDDIRESWLADARHLHVSGITPALGERSAAAIELLMRLGRKMGLTISFDPNLRRKLWPEQVARETLLSLIPLCDVFLPGIEEAKFLLGPMDEEEYLSRALALGPKVVALKLGPEGCLVGTDTVTYVPGCPVAKIVDTVGAGDAFAAGFIFGLLDDTSRLSNVVEAAKIANQMGALAVQFRGDWEGMPTLEELQTMLDGRTHLTR